MFHVSLDDLVRDTRTVEEEEKVSDDTDKKVWQENKEMTPKRRIIMVILLIAAVLLIGWQMNLFAITVIAIMWGILCVSLYWIIKKGLDLLSKYVRKGEEIYQILAVISKRKREE